MIAAYERQLCAYAHILDRRPGRREDRLLQHADVKRILFLVDTKNLGEKAEQEFMAYVPNDDNRKFTELYNVQRLKASFVAKDSQVCISTIQRMYSLLKDQEMDEAAEERSDPTAIGASGKVSRRFGG